MLHQHVQYKRPHPVGKSLKGYWWWEFLQKECLYNISTLTIHIFTWIGKGNKHHIFLVVFFLCVFLLFQVICFEYLITRKSYSVLLRKNCQGQQEMLHIAQNGTLRSPLSLEAWQVSRETPCLCRHLIGASYLPSSLLNEARQLEKS